MKTPPITILRYLYFFGLAFMIAALPLSKFVMSVGQFFLGAVLLLEYFKLSVFSKKLKSQHLILQMILFLPLGLFCFLESFFRIFERFFRKDNLPAIIFFSIFFIHILGLLYTSDFQYAFKDLRIKLPLMIFPIILSVAKPINEIQLRNLLLLLSAAVFAATLICFSYLLQDGIFNLRDISVFISHIRFSLLIVFAFFILAYYSIKKIYPVFIKAVFIIVALWFIAYLTVSVSITGLLMLAIIGLGVLLYFAFHLKNIILKYLLMLIIIAPLLIGFIYVRNIYQDVYTVKELDLNNLDIYTAQGNLYWHNFDNLNTENGYYIWFYLCSKEYKEAWDARSNIKINELDTKGQFIEGTLIRYLTSKGYRKDAKGVNALTDKEIRLIENGVANCNFQEKSALYNRINSIFWGIKKYNETHNASGHSVMQRIEYWKVSKEIINDYWLTGVGTGDVIIAIKKQYEKMNTRLEEKFRWRSHNQYLSIFIAFGIFGFLWFLFALVYPAAKMGKFRDYFFIVFFSIIMLSMLTEDTMETQAGVTIIACLYSLLVFARKNQIAEITN